jgi:nucleoside-diphosphate-sugar epimerase
MRILITGGTGFIGHHLVQQLTARGDHVIALVRSPAKAAEKLPPGTETLAGDLSLFANPSTVLPACDVVIHLAGVVAADTLAEYDAINFRAVADLVECLKRQTWKPQRLLFASSLAAAGPSTSRPWTEADTLHPIDAYGVAKAKAEVVMREAPFPTTSFRPPIVFGPGDDATLTLFKSARAGVGMCVGGAPQALSFVDVRDLVDAIVLMADDRRPG